MGGEFASTEAEPGTQEGGQPAGMRELVRAFDWASSPLGAYKEWPESLKTPVSIMLTSRFPMWMEWGPEKTVLYNDAYARTTLGRKHPWALGKPAYVVWSEIWKEIGPRIDRVMETGEASWDETLPLILERSGYPEESYHTFSYSPLKGPEGSNAGMLCVVMEDTARVLGERQLSSLSTLAGELVDANTRAEVFAAIASGLREHKDIPFALVYLFEEDSRLRLVARSGITADHPAACEQLLIGSRNCLWPGELLKSRQPVTVENMAALFPSLPTGGWDTPPKQARVVPFTSKGQETPAGIFIAGLNPYRKLEGSYAGYLDLMVGQISASITNAEAYEEERTRAESLADLDRSKTAFFSNVSHELRTPLTLILGPVEDALTSGTSPDWPSLELLHRNALRLVKLVNGLLDFVRIEAGRMNASFQPTDLSLLTAQLASVFSSAVDRAGIKLLVECPPLTEPVYVDGELWEKVVLNLVSNALKSTFDGQITVSLRSEEKDAVLTVADTGTGIPEVELPHIFERFRRVQGAKRRTHEGSGIGLALVKELVEMHGGSISVESRIGDGTSFYVRIPFGHRHLDENRVTAHGAGQPTAPQTAEAYVREALGWLPAQERLKGEVTGNADDIRLAPVAANGRSRVLLVDDNGDMLEYVRGLLGSRFDVATASNGRAALEVIAGNTPDLVLTDVMMPEMDGFALLAALRENPETRAIPVIMLSARAGDESRIEGLDAGADDYLVKPFTARELLARVEAQLKLTRLRREALEHETALSREIQQARQFAWEVLEHIPDSFATLDRDYRITYMNPAALNVTASLDRSHIGESLFDLYPMLIGMQVESMFHKAMEERVPVSFEQYFRSEDSETWFHFELYPQPVEGLIVYMRNTTEARRSEQALRRSEQLAAAGRLAASIAHEINNPLEAVTNLLFLANMDETVGAATRSLLQVADKELQRLSHITVRSLKFYRQRTSPALTSIEELIESVLFFHETEIKLRSIDLERRYRAAPQVMCLDGEIQQVLTNLIGNALEAITDRRHLYVGVSPAIDPTGQPGVAIIVADSGVGMDRFTLNRLFHPFVTTKGEAGTGLGLWVSKGIVDKHHGRIVVRSRKGSGTVFRIFLPLVARLEDAGPAL